MPSVPHATTDPRICKTHRLGHARRLGPPPRARQLHAPQGSRCAPLSRAPSTLPSLLHCHPYFQAQSGRALVRQDHHRSHWPRPLTFCAAPAQNDHGLHRRHQSHSPHLSLVPSPPITFPARSPTYVANLPDRPLETRRGRLLLSRRSHSVEQYGFDLD